jgi:hypothetical protein
MMHILYASFTTTLLLLLLPTTLHSADIRFLESLTTNHTKDDPMGFIIVPGYRSNAHHFLLGQVEHTNVGFVNCIEICRTNAKCLAVTFQVGKCLLYGRDGVGELRCDNQDIRFLMNMHFSRRNYQSDEFFLLWPKNCVAQNDDPV